MCVTWKNCLHDNRKWRRTKCRLLIKYYSFFILLQLINFLHITFSFSLLYLLYYGFWTAHTYIYVLCLLNKMLQWMHFYALNYFRYSFFNTSLILYCQSISKRHFLHNFFSHGTLSPCKNRLQYIWTFLRSPIKYNTFSSVP